MRIHQQVSDASVAKSMLVGLRCIGPKRWTLVRVSNGFGGFPPPLFVDERCIATAESVVALMDMTTHRSARRKRPWRR
jgi:hypothetical protein